MSGAVGFLGVAKKKTRKHYMREKDKQVAKDCLR